MFLLADGQKLRQLLVEGPEGENLAETVLNLYGAIWVQCYKTFTAVILAIIVHLNLFLNRDTIQNYAEQVLWCPPN